MSVIPSPEEIYATWVSVAANTRLNNLSTGKQMTSATRLIEHSWVSPVATLTWIVYDITIYFDQEVRN